MLLLSNKCICNNHVIIYHACPHELKRANKGSNNRTIQSNRTEICRKTRGVERDKKEMKTRNEMSIVEREIIVVLGRFLEGRGKNRHIPKSLNGYLMQL